MMMSRGRFSNLNDEFDSYKEDYSSTSYEPQYPVDDRSDAVHLDHCRLYIKNIPNALTEAGLRSAFAKFGTLREVFLSKDKMRRYGLVRYETPGEAKLAMTKLNNTDPLRLFITVAHMNRKKLESSRDIRGNTDSWYLSGQGRNGRVQEDAASVSSRGERLGRGLDDRPNSEEMDMLPSLDDDMDSETKMKGLQLKLEMLQVQEQAVLLKQQLLQLEATKKKNLNQSISSSNRCILPDGRIVVHNKSDRNVESMDNDGTFTAGAGDSNERDTVCSCKQKFKRPWDIHRSSEGSSTPSTCVYCYEDSNRKPDRHKQAKSVTSKYTEISKKSDYSSRFDKTTNLSRKSVASKITNAKSELSKTETANQRSEATSKKLDLARKRRKSDISCDFKYSDFYSDSDDAPDETNRLIQLRNSDYMDIVEDALKIVIALAGYPKSKMRLRQMELFQRCLADVIDMQAKAGFLKKIPSFIDYYLNRGAVVCICKDFETRDWMVRVCPGLQERMSTNLILLKPKVKRLCLAVLKIPMACWPATAFDAFKLLQYFNPTLKTELWKIYAQKCTDNVECTSFLIDRVSGEIIRGPTFKNVIDYSQMEFELTGYTEIYTDCLLSDYKDELSSLTSRAKLLEELRSEEITPRQSTTAFHNVEPEKAEVSERNSQIDCSDCKCDAKNRTAMDIKKAFENTLQKEVLKKLKDVKYISEKGEVIIWSDENVYNVENEHACNKENDLVNDMAANSLVVGSDKTESVIESMDNLIGRGSNLNIDSNRGIAYHRRTNYLHVDNELKVAIALEGYPQNKLEGTHIRRLKHLFKEYLHKDMKMQRFTNLIIPKFQDIYLSNGAVIYICDSLETKDYLAEVLPKFINSTSLKLTFRDIKSLVRYTRVVMRLPKEHAHVESLEILLKLQTQYPGLKPDCWKYYSDVAGKQKRQFGVDPESLEVIKSTDFDPMYENEKLVFRIIDRQKKDVSFEESNTKVNVIEDASDSKALRDRVLKLMYVPIDPEITNTPLTRIRTNHYADLIADDLKLYVGPSNYPETRVDEGSFHSIKKTFENIVCEDLEKGVLNESTVPKFHDMYLFDGVIFIICRNVYAREWVEQAVQKVNANLHTNLKSTEFRGAVGIISMVVKTEKDTNEVIDALQKQNPRLRTKYWRTISTVRTDTKLDVVLQIDKLSAQVITGPDFNKHIEGKPVLFKLGHLQSLLKPKSSLEELTKQHNKRAKRTVERVAEPDSKIKEKTIEELKSDIKLRYPDLKIDQWDVVSNSLNCFEICNYNIGGTSTKIFKKFENDNSEFENVIIDQDADDQMLSHSCTDRRVVMKIPPKLMPDHRADLRMLFDLLEDKNPGLNTELWRVLNSDHCNSKIVISIDTQSASVIQSKQFDSVIGGEKLKFCF